MRYLKQFENFTEPERQVIYPVEKMCQVCECRPCQCTGDECEECGCFPCECNEDIKEDLDHNLENTFSDWRINSYLKIARDKYNNMTSDEIIDKIENGPRDLRFKNEEEKNIFREKWDNEKKEGTFAYYSNLSDDELKALEPTFKHDFENPQHHNPSYVAYKKACQARQLFMGKDHTPQNFKRNKIF